VNYPNHLRSALYGVRGFRQLVTRLPPTVCKDYLAKYIHTYKFSSYAPKFWEYSSETGLVLRGRIFWLHKVFVYYFCSAVVKIIVKQNLKTKEME